MIMDYVTPIIPPYNCFYLFLLSRPVDSNRLIFDPSEVEINQYRAMFTLSGDNVQSLLSTFNEKKTKIKEYDHNTFLDM